MSVALRPVHGLALCAGGGGLELGLRLALGDGYRTVGFVEREAFAAAALVARMEDQALDQAPVWDDVGTFDGRPWRGCVDVLSAGFSCQPWSSAGKGLGTEDERWIWPDIARVVREVGPGLVFLENVPPLVSRGGLALVLADLAEAGFDAEWLCLRAGSVGATQRRERLFVLGVADSPSERRQQEPDSPHGDAKEDGGGRAHNRVEPQLVRRQPGDHGLARDDSDGQGSPAVADPAGARPQGSGLRGHARSGRPFFAPPGPDDTDSWRRVLAVAPGLEPSLRRVADGLAGRMERPELANRRDRLRLLGNGVHPMAAAVAFRVLAERAGVPIEGAVAA